MASNSEFERYNIGEADDRMAKELEDANNLLKIAQDEK